MFGAKKASEDYESYVSAVESLEGNYYGFTEHPEFFNKHSLPKSGVAYFKQYDDGFGFTSDFEGLEEFIRKHQVPWVLPLNDQAISRVFKQGSPAMFLFSKDPKAKDTLTEISASIQGSLQLVHGDITLPQHRKLADALGISEFPLPVALILSEDFKKYVHFGADDTDALESFYNDWKNGEVKAYYKSGDVSTVEDSVWVLTALGFSQYVGKEDVLVQFYIPDCGYSRLLQPEYEIVAEELTEIKVAHIDYSKNEIEGVNFTEFPKVIFFPRGSDEGIEYKGDWVARDIVDFVRKHYVPVEESMRIEL